MCSVMGNFAFTENILGREDVFDKTVKCFAMRHIPAAVPQT